MSMDRDSPDFCAFEWGECEEGRLAQKKRSHMFHMCNRAPEHTGNHRCGDCAAFKHSVKRK